MNGIIQYFRAKQEALSSVKRNLPENVRSN